MVNSLRFCRDALNVTWRDGAISSFPSMWLRASTRDPKFFDQQSLIHRPEHLEFLLKDSQLVSVEQARGKYLFNFCLYCSNRKGNYEVG